MYVCMHACMHVCMYACMFTHMYVYKCTHTICSFARRPILCALDATRMAMKCTNWVKAVMLMPVPSLSVPAQVDRP